MISNEHPEVLERVLPTLELETRVKRGIKRLREAQTMRVISEAGTDLLVDVSQAPVVGVAGDTLNVPVLSLTGLEGFVFAFLQLEVSTACW